MSTVTIYTFEGEDGEFGCYQTPDPIEARKYAEANQVAVVANEYEWSEALIVPEWDYRPTPAEGSPTVP